MEEIYDPFYRRDTPYATELARASFISSTNDEGRVERLRFKKSPYDGVEGIRFSWWKEGQMVPRPLDATEDQLLELMKSALDEQVFSKNFLGQLRKMLQK